MPAPISAALWPKQWQLCSFRDPKSGIFTVKVALGDEEKKAEVEKEQGLRKDWFPTMGQFLSLRATDSLAIELARRKNYNNSELVSTKSAYWVVTVKVPGDTVQSWWGEEQAYVFPWGLRYGGEFFDLKDLKYSIEYVLALRGGTGVEAAPSKLILHGDMAMDVDPPPDTMQVDL